MSKIEPGSPLSDSGSKSISGTQGTCPAGCSGISGNFGHFREWVPPCELIGKVKVSGYHRRLGKPFESFLTHHGDGI